VTAGQPPSPEELRAGLEELRLEVGRTTTWTDELASAVLLQAVALEELLFARWPRSILVRRRWRRDLRESMRHIDGHDFTTRRINTLGTGWVTRPGSGFEIRVHWTGPVTRRER
jgi:hypothetical protein